MLLNENVTEAVIGAAMEVHRTLGPGLLEAVYEEGLYAELQLQGIACARQVRIPLTYKGRRIDIDYRMDMLVQACVVVEIKSVEAILPVHEAQLLTYLKLTNLRTGLLINFNVPVLRDGICRRVL